MNIKANKTKGWNKRTKKNFQLYGNGMIKNNRKDAKSGE